MKWHFRFGFGLKLFIGLMVLAGIAVLVCISPMFNLKSMEVSGNRHYESEALQDASGIILGSNGFRTLAENLAGIPALHYKNAENSILRKCPYVKSVSVSFRLPSTVQIKVDERNPAYLVPYMGTSLLLDREGFVLDTVNGDQKTGHPMVTGIEIQSYELGSELAPANLQCMETVSFLLETLEAVDKNEEEKIAGTVSSIDVSNPEGIYLFLDSRITVKLGNTQDLYYRVEVMKHIFFRNIGKNEKGLLDFTETKDPVLKKDKDNGGVQP